MALCSTPTKDYTQVVLAHGKVNDLVSSRMKMLETKLTEVLATNPHKKRVLKNGKYRLDSQIEYNKQRVSNKYKNYL